MPALPWVERQAIESDRTYQVMASRLPLTRYRSIPGFLRDTLSIRKQLAEAPGLVGYSLDADLAHKMFWTFSVWTDRASLESFACTDPPRRIIQRLRPLMEDTHFEFVESLGSATPETWPARKALVIS